MAEIDQRTGNTDRSDSPGEVENGKFTLQAFGEDSIAKFFEQHGESLARQLRELATCKVERDPGNENVVEGADRLEDVDGDVVTQPGCTHHCADSPLGVGPRTHDGAREGDDVAHSSVPGKPGGKG